jgi:uncharacterized protein (TIGR01777 family)
LAKTTRIRENDAAERVKVTTENEPEGPEARLGTKPMKLLVSGAGGLVGNALRTSFSENAAVRPLVRGRSANDLWWDPETGAVNAPALNEWRPDVFVHLAGENIATHRWNAEQKRRIHQSRVPATERLVRSLLSLEKPPPLFIGASAVGYYGNRGEEELTEQSTAGNDFLAEVCREWEAATAPLEAAGVRVVHLRFGMILSCEGGALARMFPIFRLGLGGKLGSGKQWLSWVALTDVVRMIQWAIMAPNAQGAYNAVSPHPVRNVEFTKALGRVLQKPTFLPVPAGALRLAFGEMADALLLTSQRAAPKRLLAEGFRFDYSEVEAALRHELQIS